MLWTGENNWITCYSKSFTHPAVPGKVEMLYPEGKDLLEAGTVLAGLNVEPLVLSLPFGCPIERGCASFLRIHRTF
jgi:hypothetical protein